MMVAICERASLYREALEAVVRSRGHDVVCSVSLLADAVRVIERCNPDVVLLDVSSTDQDSLAQLARRRRRGLASRVLLLTGSEEGSSGDAVLEAGLADGILDRGVALATLERAVNGQLTSVSKPRRKVAPTRRDWGLTVRELEVIALLLTGRATTAIASALGVSPSTVHSHVQSILRKLGARNRIEAVSIYLGETTPQPGPVPRS